ncbi:MAG: protein kinase [Planctomycetes bacterium]|nr:protein kinase [Planctomycetota bacterium]
MNDRPSPEPPDAARAPSSSPAARTSAGGETVPDVQGPTRLRELRDLVRPGAETAQGLQTPGGPPPTGCAASPPAAQQPSPTLGSARLPRLLATFGDYDILDEVARGGMGVVFRARHRTLDRVVALKVLLEGEGASAQQVQRLQREASAAARLQHPSIVQVYEVGVVDGVHYFTMEFVEGRTLFDVIEREHPSPRDVAEIARRVAEALAYAHEKGVVHRDVKPQNVLLGRDGLPRLSDFGLAKDFARDAFLTASGTTLGTPMYMSPEQARGSKDLDPRTDVYSLGAVLFHGLTGRPPFDGASAFEVLQAVVAGEPREMRTCGRQVNRDLETISLKAMEKDPARRYATAKELAEDLGRFLEGRPILARRPALARRMALFVARHRGAAILVVGLASLLVAGIRFRRLDEARRLEVGTLVEQVRDAMQQSRVRRGIPAKSLDEEVRRVNRSLELAVSRAERAVELDPSSTAALRMRAELHLFIGWFPQAAQGFERVAALRPEDEAAAYLGARARQEATLDGDLDAAPFADLLPRLHDPALRALARARQALAEHRLPDAADRLTEAQAAGADRSEVSRVRAYVDGAYGSAEWQRQAVEEMEACIDWGEGTFCDFLYLARWSRADQEPEFTGRCYANALSRVLPLSLGRTLEYEWARFLDGCGRREEADLHVARGISADPTSPWGYLARAEILFGREEFAAARRDLASAMERAPTNPMLLAKVLKYCLRWPDGRDVRTLYRELREKGGLDPASSDTWARGDLDYAIRTLLDAGLVDEAGELLQVALRRFPDLAEFHADRGELHAQKKEWDAALADYDRAIALSPYVGKYYVGRARCHRERRANLRAIADLTRAIELDPGDRSRYVQRALQYFQTFQFAPGVADIAEGAMKSTVEEVDGLRRDLEEGRPSELFGKVDRGTLRLALGLLPNLCAVLCARGDDAMHAGKFDEARSAYERARAVAPKSWPPSFGLARVHAARREHDLAVLRLLEAADNGFADPELLEGEPLFSDLRGHEEFKKVRARLVAGPKR